MHALPSISIIVTTYNWPQALDRVLCALSQQDYDRLEIIIADDGSTDETIQLIQDWQSRISFPLLHSWQKDEGFRAAMARNRAAAMASHDYLIFIDGDCVPFQNFTLHHAKLAEHGWFVAGNRILLSQPLTQDILRVKAEIQNWSFRKWCSLYLKRSCNQFFSLYPLPFDLFRKLSAKQWKDSKTCNLGIWRKDFFEINGFDEDFQGWGFEDSDLVIRLQRLGVRRKSGKFSVPVLHLWHPLQDKTKLHLNAQRLNQTLESQIIQATKGINQYTLRI